MYSRTVNLHACPSLRGGRGGCPSLAQTTRCLKIKTIRSVRKLHEIIFRTHRPALLPVYAKCARKESKKCWIDSTRTHAGFSWSNITWVQTGQVTKKNTELGGIGSLLLHPEAKAGLADGATSWIVALVQCVFIKFLKFWQNFGCYTDIVTIMTLWLNSYTRWCQSQCFDMLVEVGSFA